MPKAVIMAGGQGERFWPVTHAKFPKYRIKFYGNKSLLQKTYERLRRVYAADSVYVITTQSHAPMIRQELSRLPRANILIEPSRKNTAPAIYLSCALIQKKHGAEEVVSFFPADHLIQDEKLFEKTLRQAIKTARRTDNLVTIGIKPSFPATGYGYIETGRALGDEAYRVQRFVEKPVLSVAKTYIRRGNFYWNGGIFTWRISIFMRAMEKHAPAITKVLDLSNLRSSYLKLPNLSIDYALMEKADNIALCRAAMDWCDVGNWDMFYEKSPSDKTGCYIEGLSLHKENRNSLLVNHTELPLITLGISDLIVVQTPRGTLVCRKNRAEEAALLFKKIAA